MRLSLTSRSPRILGARLLLALPLLGAAACGDDGDPGPTEPTRPTMSAAARGYLTAALDSTQAVFYYGDRMSWPAWRQSAFAAASTAQTFADTYPALESAIQGLNDPHSFFYKPSESIGERDDPDHPYFKPYGAAVAPRVAYLWLPTFGGRNLLARADSIQMALAKADSTPNVCGWVLDLRGNPGGFWAPMLAGLSPLMTPGLVGGFVERDTTERVFYEVQPGYAGIRYKGTAYQLNGGTLSRSYELRNKGLPIAILQGRNTASAGEIIVMAFKEPDRAVRTFGAPTYGVTSQPYTFRLVDRASVQVTAALMFDRQRRTYNGGAVPPDQAVAGPNIGYGTYVPGSNTANDAVITAATAWLNEQPSCRSAPPADVEPRPGTSPGGLFRSVEPVPGARSPSAWPRPGTPWVAGVPRATLH